MGCSSVVECLSITKERKEGREGGERTRNRAQDVLLNKRPPGLLAGCSFSGAAKALLGFANSRTGGSRCWKAVAASHPITLQEDEFGGEVGGNCPQTL